MSSTQSVEVSRLQYTVEILHREQSRAERSVRSVNTMLSAAMFSNGLVSLICLFQLRREGPFPLLAALIAEVLTILGLLRFSSVQEQILLFSRLIDGSAADFEAYIEHLKLLIAEFRKARKIKTNFFRASLIFMMIALLLSLVGQLTRG